MHPSCYPHWHGHNTGMDKILLVDDDQSLASLLQEYLQQEGFCCDIASDGELSLQALEQQTYSLVILDIMLPKISGIEVLKRIRQRFSQLPVIMLTARGDDIDRIVGLELGADDYLPKPCNPRELLARMRAILRRSQKPQSQASGPLKLEPQQMQASLFDQILDLTATEFKILQTLARDVGEMVDKNILSEAALGRPLGRYDRSVDVHVSNVRKKLIAAGANPNCILSQRGMGYQLVPFEDK